MPLASFMLQKSGCKPGFSVSLVLGEVRSAGLVQQAKRQLCERKSDLASGWEWRDDTKR